jgi:hypothetical protein
MSLVLRHDDVHRIPRQQIVTTAKRPSIGHGTARSCRDDLPDGQSEIFLREGVDSRLSVDLVREIRFLAQSIGVVSLGSFPHDYSREVIEPSRSETIS